MIRLRKKTPGSEISSNDRVAVYDLSNAGPRHRFTIMTDQGPMIVHNCILGLGYGAGGERFNLMLKTSANSVDLGSERCKEIVFLYRKKYSRISGMWRQCAHVLEFMASGQSGEFGTVLKMRYDPEHLYLPNGMNIYYPKLHWSEEDNAFVYLKKKTWTRIFGAKFVENMIQALARIVVFNQMGAIAQILEEMNKEDGKRRQVVLMVHDEVVVVVPKEEAEKVKTLMETAMSRPPRWASGLPVSCEAGIGNNYGEAK